MKAISHFEVEVDSFVYHGSIHLQDAQPKSYTADWHCTQNGKEGNLGYNLPECHLVELAAEKEIRKRHHNVA